MTSRRQRQLASHRTHQQMTENVQQLQGMAQLHLTDKEQRRLFSAIATYRKQPNIAALVEQLAPVCNTVAKRQLLSHIRTLLPEREYPAFDKLLAVHRLAPAPTSASTGQAGVRSAGSRQGARAVDRGSSSLRQTTPGPVSPTTSFDRVQPVAESRQPQRRVPKPKPTKLVVRPDEDGALGFDIRGGKEHGLGIFVSLVESGSQAEKNGLVSGQLILKSNGVSFENVSYEKAVEVLTNNAAGSLRKIRLSVLQPNEYPSEQYPLIQYFWLDSKRRPTSPPPEYRSGINLLKPVEDVPAESTRKVSIATDSTQQLGISIRGGVEHGLGVYVSHVEPGSLSHNYGLRVGDQLLDINGLICNTLMHDEAAEILQSNEVLVMTVRSVNKVPIRPITPQDQVTANWAQSKAATDFLMGRRTPSTATDPGIRRPAAQNHRASVASQQAKRISSASAGTASSQDSQDSRRSVSPVVDSQMAAAAPNYDPEPTISQSVALGPRPTTTRSYFADLKASGEESTLQRNSLRDPARKQSEHRNSYRSSSSFDEADMPSPLSEQLEAGDTLASVGDVRKDASQPVAQATGFAASEWKAQPQASPRATAAPRLGSNKVGPAAARAMIDKNAGLVLSSDELRTLNYYLDQYVERNLSIKQLVMALSTLLDTNEKRHILERIRAVVGQRDTDRYEELILPYLEEMREEHKPSKPPPPTRQESLVDYTAFNASSFGHNAYVSDDESDDGRPDERSRGDTMDSMMANAGVDTPRSSTMNSDVTFSTPASSLLPTQGKKMQEAMKPLQEKDESEGSVKGSSGNQLKVYEEEFGHESPMPERKKSPAKIHSAKDNQPSTIPISRGGISADLLSSTKLKPTAVNEDQVSPVAETVPKENQQAMMLAETLVSRRNKINPGSIRRVVVRHGMPRSLSIESSVSAQQPHEADHSDEDEQGEPRPHRISGGRASQASRKVSTDDNVPQTIVEEDPEAAHSPKASRRVSPRHSKSSGSPASSPTEEVMAGERRRPPSPNTAIKAIMNAASRVQNPSPKMPKRVDTSASTAAAAPAAHSLPSPVPMPRSASRQSSLNVEAAVDKGGLSPSPKPRHSLLLLDEDSKRVAASVGGDSFDEVISAPPGNFADDTPEAEESPPPPLPATSPPPLSPAKDDIVAATDKGPGRVQAADTGDLYSVPDKQQLQMQAAVAVEVKRSSPPAADDAVHHLDSGTGDLYAIPDKSQVVAEAALREAAPRRNGLEQSVEMVPPSTRPGKTYAGYTGLFGDIKTILVEKNGLKLGIAVTGGANTKQREVRIKEIVPHGAAATCHALRPQMQILAVDGQSLKGLPHRQAVLLVKHCFDSPKLRLELSVHIDQEYNETPFE